LADPSGKITLRDLGKPLCALHSRLRVDPQYIGALLFER
jgi:hypothetical protein